MKWLKYTYCTAVPHSVDEDGNVIEREVLTEKAVPDTDAGRALAEKEAYGEITEYNDGQEESTSPTLESRVNTLEADSAEMSEALDLLLSGVTE